MKKHFIGLALFCCFTVQIKWNLWVTTSEPVIPNTKISKYVDCKYKAL